MAGVVAPMEGHHDLGADVVQLIGQGRQLIRIEGERLLHQRRDSGARDLQGERRMGTGRGRDDDAVEGGQLLGQTGAGRHRGHRAAWGEISG